MYFYFSWSLYTVSLFLTSSFLFRFRLLCQSIIAHKLFDYVVLAFIFSNCITVALERPKILQGSLVRLRPMDLWFRFLTYCFNYWWFPCCPQADILTALTKFQLFPFYSFHNFALFFLSLLLLFLQERLFLTVSNYIFTAIFVGEMTLKVNIYIHSIIYCADFRTLMYRFFLLSVCADMPLICVGESRENNQFGNCFHSNCRDSEYTYYFFLHVLMVWV